MNEDVRGWFRAQRDMINMLVIKHNETNPESTVEKIDWRTLKAGHMTNNIDADDVMKDQPEVE